MSISLSGQKIWKGSKSFTHNILANLNQTKGDGENAFTGYAHIAFSVGSKEMVDKLTTDLQAAGFKLLSGPRTTGDGYYESVILDPDGNSIEITI